MAIDPELLKILACPLCKGALDGEPKADHLSCPRCKLSFPVRDGVPVLLPPEAPRP